MGQGIPCPGPDPFSGVEDEHVGRHRKLQDRLLTEQHSARCYGLGSGVPMPRSVDPFYLFLRRCSGTRRYLDTLGGKDYRGGSTSRIRMASRTASTRLLTWSLR
jgi:hypothetical protein